MSNLALRLAGPCVLTYKGATFASKGDVTLDLFNDTFDVGVDAYGTVDKRANGKLATAKFTPIGDWANLSVLFPAALQVIGGLTTPVKSFASTDVNASTDVVTCTAHGFATGAAVRLFSFGTIPGGLTAGTLYYLRAASANTFTLHTTRAGAVGNSALVDLTTQGSGTHRLIEQEPLSILTAENELYTFHVAALQGMPVVTGRANETLFGEVTFDLFRIVNTAATTSNSLFTLGTSAWTPPSIDPTTILTQSYLMSWGNAPWANLETVNGIVITPQVSLEDVTDDALGVIGKRVADFQVTAAAQPLGIQPSDVLNALLLQGSGAQRGARLGTNNNFVMSASGVTVTLSGAGLRSAPHAFGRTADRIGTLEWFATRTFTAGVPNAMLTVA